MARTEAFVCVPQIDGLRQLPGLDGLDDFQHSPVVGRNHSPREYGLLRRVAGFVKTIPRHQDQSQVEIRRGHPPRPLGDVIVRVKPGDNRTREQAGLTKRALAERVGISEQLMGEIESGWRNATPANLLKTADALNCPIVLLERKRSSAPDCLAFPSGRGRTGGGAGHEERPRPADSGWFGEVGARCRQVGLKGSV
ncbi:helix-turn-helix transcriptional regulator [Streptomyces sp. NBC_00433]